MKIAFDTMGTLQGKDSVKVVALYKALRSRGHDMVVWSSEYALARNINEKLNLHAEVMHKFDKFEAAEQS